MCKCIKPTFPVGIMYDAFTVIPKTQQNTMAM